MVKRIVVNNNLNTIKNDIEYIDILIQNAVDLIKIVYKDIKSIYLIGSYVDNQDKYASDIDLMTSKSHFETRRRSSRPDRLPSR